MARRRVWTSCFPEDFHLQANAHAGRTTRSGGPFGAAASLLRSDAGGCPAVPFPGKTLVCVERTETVPERPRRYSTL